MRPCKPEPVMDAIYWGGIALLRNLLAEGADANEVSGTGDLASTALSSAVGSGSLEMVQCLLDHGADPDRDGTGDHPPIISAASDNRVDVMEALYQAGADLNATSRKWDTVSALMVAARRGAMDAVRWLVAHGCDINRRSRNGVTPLYFAMLDRDQPEVIAELLALGADPWLRSELGHTALAVGAGRRWGTAFGLAEAEAVLRRAMGERGLALRVALEHKARWLRALPEPRLIPLVEAAMIGDLALVRNLLAEGADPDQASPLPLWNTALEYAVRDNALDMARCLLDHGADPGRKGWGGVTPLMIATSHNHVAMMRLLVRAGADVNTSVRWRRMSALTAAARYHHVEAARFLIARGCDIHRRTTEGGTALHDAAQTGDDPVMIRLLLAAGVDPAIPNRRGETACEVARFFRHSRTRAILARARRRRRPAPRSSFP